MHKAPHHRRSCEGFWSVAGKGSGGCLAGRLLPIAILLLGVATCGVEAHHTAPSQSTGVDEPGGTGGAGPVDPPVSGGTGGTSGSVFGTGGSGTSPGGSGGVSGTGNVSGTGTGGSNGSPGGSGGQPGASGSGGARAGTGGATASGPGVMINGAFVPKEKAVAILHFGHSNMRGYARSPTSLNSYFFNTQDGLWSFKNNAFTLAKEPTAPEANQTGTAGPGMALLRAAQTTATAGSGVQFISIGYGKGSATSVDFAKNGTYYPTFMGWANQLKGKVTFGAIVIMLGITERHLPTTQIPAFPTRIAQIVADIRADLGEPNLPVLFCDYEMEASRDLAADGAVGQQMIPLLKMLPTMVKNLVLVPTDGLGMQDDHHFNLEGHKAWADRAIALMKTNNWFPW